MQKSPDLMDITELAAYYGVSESTIRRKVRKSRENGCGFITPIFSAGSRLLWRRVDVENFRSEDAETIHFHPSSVPSIPPAAQIKNHAQVQRELQKLGVKLPTADNN